MSKKPPARIRRATEANDAVEHILSETNRTGAELSRIPEALENVQRLRQGIGAVWSPRIGRTLGRETLLQVNDFVQRQAVIDIWRRQGRIAYNIHPEMAASLYRANLKGKLPGELFNRLPHISPMLPLPRPWPFRNEHGRNGLIRAYFLTGRVGQAVCKTTDERSEGLALMPWIQFDDIQETGYNPTVTPLFALPAVDGPFTLDDVIDFTDAWQGTTSEGNEKKLVRQIIPGALSVLTYLCCDNRDVQEPPPAPAKANRRQAPSRDPFYVNVGWKIGPRLHANRVRAQGRSHDGVSFPSGIEQDPQHRVGHYKVIHHGPGKTQQDLKWVDPYWTKRDLLEADEEPITSIVPVDAQRQDPAGHRDVKLANLGTRKAKEIRDREAQRYRDENPDWD